MKKKKLSSEEKKEIRQEKKSWNEMIRRLTKKGAVIEEIKKP